jgi:hypothetical protein
MANISPKLRKDIIDYISVKNIAWSGNLDDVEFLSRLYNLGEMPSFDSRFKDAAGDIHQHRVNNYDWPDDWVFTDPRFNILNSKDEKFLEFLCEMLHPLVRDEKEAEQLSVVFNKLLNPVGISIKLRYSMIGIGGYVYEELRGGADLVAISHTVATSIDTMYIRNQIERMTSAIDSDVDLAIGTAKEFIETICKTILQEKGIEPGTDVKITHLVKQVREYLKLLPDDVSEQAKGKEVIKVLLSNLGAIAQDIAELRRLYGTGHGKGANAQSLWKRHARLAVNSSIALGVFLWDTYQDRKY